MKTLVQAVRGARTPVAARQVYEDCRNAVTSAVSADDYPTAMKCVTLAETCAKRTGSQHFAVEVRSQRQEVVQLSREYRKIAKSIERARSGKASAKDYRLAGLYVAMAHGRFDVAEKWLAQSDSDTTRRLARVLALKPENASQYLAVGRVFRTAAAAETPSQIATLLYRRGYENVSMAFRSSSGATMDTVSKELNQFPFRHLTDFEPTTVIPGPWPFSRYGQSGGKFGIIVNQRPYRAGLGLHPPANGHASAAFVIDRQFKNLMSGVALNDYDETARTGVRFQVLGDQKLLWQSRAIHSRGDVEFVSIPIKNVSVLEIRTLGMGSDHNCHAVWLDPVLTR